jgi:hypothetical protein
MANPADYVFSDSEFMKSIVQEISGLLQKTGNGMVLTQKASLTHELDLVKADKEYATVRLEGGMKFSETVMKSMEAMVVLLQQQAEKNSERYEKAMKMIDDDPRISSADVRMNPIGGLTVNIRKK